MRTPFGRLMELVADIPEDDTRTVAELSREWGEAPGRILDAVEAVRIVEDGTP